MNQSGCGNVSVDLSESSLRLTLNKHMLAAVVVSSCVISVFTVVANVVIIVALTYSRRKASQSNSSGINNTTKLLVASFAFGHVILGGVCMPMVILQISGNGEWKYGPNLCTARTYLESLTMSINVYQVVSMTADTYLAICQPIKYRLLTSKYGYTMLVFTWTVPSAIFALPVFMAGYREGVEDIFECLASLHSCITIYGKNVLLVVLPLVTALSFCFVLVTYFLILRKIASFHNKRLRLLSTGDDSRKKTSTKINPAQNIVPHTEEIKEQVNNNSPSAKTIAKVDGINLCIAAVTNQMSPNQTSKYTSPKLTEVTSETRRIRHVQETRLQRKPVLDRRWKAFSYMITVAIWHGVNWFSIMVCFLYFAFNPSKIPVWSVLTVSSLCYLNALVNPIFFFCNTYVRESVKNVMKRILLCR